MRFCLISLSSADTDVGACVKKIQDFKGGKSVQINSH